MLAEPAASFRVCKASSRHSGQTCEQYLQSSCLPNTQGTPAQKESVRSKTRKAAHPPHGTEIAGGSKSVWCSGLDVTDSTTLVTLVQLSSQSAGILTRLPSHKWAVALGSLPKTAGMEHGLRGPRLQFPPPMAPHGPPRASFLELSWSLHDPRAYFLHVCETAPDVLVALNQTQLN